MCSSVHKIDLRVSRDCGYDQINTSEGMAEFCLAVVIHDKNCVVESFEFGTGLRHCQHFVTKPPPPHLTCLERITT